MSESPRTHEDLPFLDLDYLTPLARRFEMKLHIPFDLIEELIPRFDMEIEPRIGPAQYHHKEIFMMNEQAIGPKRRVEIIFVCFNPVLEMVSAQQFHGLFSPILYLE